MALLKLVFWKDKLIFSVHYTLQQKNQKLHCDSNPGLHEPELSCRDSHSILVHHCHQSVSEKEKGRRKEEEKKQKNKIKKRRKKK